MRGRKRERKKILLFERCIHEKNIWSYSRRKCYDTLSLTIYCSFIFYSFLIRNVRKGEKATKEEKSKGRMSEYNPHSLGLSGRYLPL